MGEEQRQHTPKTCGSCPAQILWAAVLQLDDDFESPTFGKWIRVKNEDTGRYRSMPVDWEPTPRGNIVVYWREGEGFVCRTLKHGEQPAAGEKLRTSHFVTCPNAPRHRKKKAQRCGGVQDLDPAMRCELCGDLGAFPATMKCAKCTFGDASSGATP